TVPNRRGDSNSDHDRRALESGLLDGEVGNILSPVELGAVKLCAHSFIVPVNQHPLELGCHCARNTGRQEDESSLERVQSVYPGTLRSERRLQGHSQGVGYGRENHKMEVVLIGEHGQASERVGNVVLRSRRLDGLVHHVAVTGNGRKEAAVEEALHPSTAVPDELALCLREEQDQHHRVGRRQDGQEPEDPPPAYSLGQDPADDRTEAGCGVRKENDRAGEGSPLRNRGDIRDDAVCRPEGA
ncbi:3f635e44-638d-4cdb-bab9-d73eb0c3528b, partial [Thermothielavioides terrestris]